ncbi:helix-turn-helix domain-containing protein [Catenuloplanes sp. NPDC051500]|uniref:helix-turn-helix domain-containing protein n=1 Tax=Catenuloplanes sp. NPDC051500 TaxID=3363959 RepID=UPI00379361FA
MGTFDVDADATGTGRDTWEPFIDTWNDRMGDLYPLPEFTESTVDGFQGTMRSVTLKDAAVNEFWAHSRVSTKTVGREEQDQVRLYVGLRGVLALREPDGHGGDAHVPAGTYFLHHCARENQFRTTPEIASRVFVLPGDDLRHLIAGRSRSGRASEPMAQILMSHAGMLQRTVGHLGPDEARTARNALLELAKGLILSRFDDHESAFAPTLVQAAMDVADTRLTDAGLSTATIAALLHVSVRTLQRAFADRAESLTAYVRRRRLEEAAQAFLRPGSRLTVSEAAAIWHFTDGSHFIRCFKKEFHATPRQFQSLHGAR